MLKGGMWWFYKGALTESIIREAIVFHRKKYPSAVVHAIYANPSDIGEIYNVDGLPVRPDKVVVGSNLFIAVNE